MRQHIANWFPLIRPFTLTAGAVPVLVGSALAAWEGVFFVDRFLAMLVCSVLIQAATNMLNEYEDFHRGLDTHESVGNSGSIVLGHLTDKAVLRGALVTLGLALLSGLYLVVTVSPWLLAVGAVAVLGAFLYSGGPKAIAWTPFGEAQVFVLMGLLLVGLGYYVQMETITGAVIVAALPVSFLVAAILLGNNIRDMVGDAAKGRRTLVIVAGRQVGIRVLAALLGGAYVVIAAAVVARVVPWTALIALLSLPLAPGIIRRFQSTAVPAALHPAVKGIARLHLVLGTLYAAGIALAILR
ncbi:MAG: 1,4-dihydroxy-2-naphthoate polyprenyltransferase [Thermomicrobiales bacterium]